MTSRAPPAAPRARPFVRARAAVAFVAVVGAALLLCGRPSPSLFRPFRPPLFKSASSRPPPPMRRAPALGGRPRALRVGPIFFHIYVPPNDPAGRTNALSIVREQFDEIDGSSPALVGGYGRPVRYALIGDATASAEIEEMCLSNGQRTNCTMLSTSAWEGNEYATLQPLFEYCRDRDRDREDEEERGDRGSEEGKKGGRNEDSDSEESPSVWVTYLHNKGSYHPSRENDVLRRMTTKAAISAECQTAPGDMCNVCSARFSPQPFLHSSGNVWTADCDYVRELIPPLYFFPAMEEVFDEKAETVLGWTNGGRGWRWDEDRPYESRARNESSPLAPYRPDMKPSVYEQAWHTGRGRWAMEHWVHSHPAQRPCDVFPGPWNLEHENLPDSGTDWTPDLRAAPRRESLEEYQFGKMDRMKEDEWFCGAESRLYEFGRLYGEIPGEESWFWSFYGASKGFCASSPKI